MDVFDIKLNEQTFDLATDGGDILIGESTEQHKYIAVLSAPGDLKEFPMVGVAIENYINDERPGDIIEAIRKGLTDDGMKVEHITMSEEGKIIIDAGYE